MDVATPGLKRDFYPLRLIATGLSFACFSVGALCLRVVVIPVLGLWPGNELARRRRARGAISRGFWLLAQFMYRTRILDFRFDGVERLGRPGQMIVANHPSLIDVVFLFAYLRDTNCIVKASFWRNPCSSGPVRSAQYIPNNGEGDMLEIAADTLREGQTLIVFPEGTRTTPGQPPVFHRGAAAIALRGASTITPVFITVEPTTLTKAERWYHIPPRRIQVRLRVGDDILPSTFNDSAPLPIASRRLNDHLHRLFLKELHSQ